MDFRLSAGGSARRRFEVDSKGTNMRRILLAVDGSDHSHRAVEFTGTLALRFDSEVTVLHVVEDVGTIVPPEFEAYARIERFQVSQREIIADAAHRITIEAEKMLRQMGVSEITTQVEIGHPAAAIVAWADKSNADMIVMGRRGLTDLAGLFQGSVTHKVSHLADCTVVTVK